MSLPGPFGAGLRAPQGSPPSARPKVSIRRAVGRVRPRTPVGAAGGTDRETFGHGRGGVGRPAPNGGRPAADGSVGRAVGAVGPVSERRSGGLRAVRRPLEFPEMDCLCWVVFRP
jgi:hypothetical protein